MDRYTVTDVRASFRALARAMQFHGVNTQGWYVSHMQGAGWIIEDTNATGEASRLHSGTFQPITRYYLHAREFCHMAHGIMDGLRAIENARDPERNSTLKQLGEPRRIPESDRDLWRANGVPNVRGDGRVPREFSDAWYIPVAARGEQWIIFLGQYGEYTARNLAGDETRHISMDAALAYIAGCEAMQ